MKLGARLAGILPARLQKFAAHWAALDEERRQVCTRVVILVEMVGGRGKAAAILGISDNTIDNHRKGTGDVSHAALRELTERAGLPQATLYLNWSVEEGELQFADTEGRRVLGPDERERSGSSREEHAPFPYPAGHAEGMRPAGMAEEDDLAHLLVPQDYLGRLDVEPRNLIAMVSGDAGMAPEVEPGAFLLVDISDRNLTDGCLYVLNAGNGSIIRRIRRLAEGGVELLTADGSVSQHIGEAQLAELGVIGRLRSHSRSV
jgi:phage repressor protein C with HTH and peptisase S24 domain